MIQKYNRVKTNEGKKIWEKEFKKNNSTCDMISNQEIMGFWRQTDMNRDRIGAGKLRISGLFVMQWRNLIRQIRREMIVYCKILKCLN